MGPEEACARDLEGAWQCWAEDGSPTFGPAVVSEPRLGPAHSCAVDPAGEITCWGSPDSWGALRAPGGTYTRVAHSGNVPNDLCMLGSDGAITCFNDVEAPEGTYAEMRAERFGSAWYALDAEGVPACFGAQDCNLPLWPVGTAFDDLVISSREGCATPSDPELGGTQCWGLPGGMQGRLTDLRIYGARACGLDEYHRAVCSWDGQHIPADDGARYRDLALVWDGIGMDCALSEDDGEIQCWGAGVDGVTLPEGSFERFAALGPCALREDGSVGCAESNQWVAPPLPDGLRLRELSTRRGSACGILRNGELRCWGELLR